MNPAESHTDKVVLSAEEYDAVRAALWCHQDRTWSTSPLPLLSPRTVGRLGGRGGRGLLVVRA